MTAEVINRLITPLIFIVFSVGFTVIWLQYRHLKSAGYLALSYLCGAIAFSFDFAEGFQTDAGHTPTLFARMIGDQFYPLITLFFTIGIARRYDQPIPQLPLFALFFAVSIGMPVIGYGNMELRSYFVSSFCASMLLLAIPLITRSSPQTIDRILAWLTGLSAFLLVASTVAVHQLTNEDLTMVNFWNSSFLAMINFTVAVNSLSVAVVLFVGFGMTIIADYRKRSSTDVLSNVLNRRGFEEVAIAALNRAHDNNLPLSIIVADIDHFKSVNDNYGHDFGDEVIRNFASTMKSACRAGATVGRVGGEEFCMLLPGSSQEVAALAAEGIRTAISTVDHSNGTIESGMFVTVSFGVAELRPDETYLSLFRRADKALYEAKTQGRDRVCRAEEDEATRIRYFRDRLAG